MAKVIGRLIWYFFIIIVLSAQGVQSQNLVSLAYDDGEAEEGLWIDSGRGHSVVFTTPCDNWTLSRVAIFGSLAPTNDSDIFVIEIWDEDLNLVSRTTDKSKSYFNDSFSWAYVDMPNAQLSGDFFISFYEFGEVYLGVDSTFGFNRSLITARNPNRVMEWDVVSGDGTIYESNQTNWMIRAEGYSAYPPEISLAILSDVATSANPSTIDVKLKDPDDNLKGATLYIIDNESRDVIWSEAKALEGGEAEIQFAWAGKMFQLLDRNKIIAPVFAINNIYAPENISSFIAYSSACFLKMEEDGSEIAAFAYFGEDGKFNALADALGRTYYLSEAFLNFTSPDTNYQEYIKKEIAFNRDESSLTFYKISSQNSEILLTYYPPILLSGSALFNYNIELQIIDASPGEYNVIVEVEDWAYNVISETGKADIRIV